MGVLREGPREEDTEGRLFPGAPPPPALAEPPQHRLSLQMLREKVEKGALPWDPQMRPFGPLHRLPPSSAPTAFPPCLPPPCSQL